MEVRKVLPMLIILLSLYYNYALPYNFVQWNYNWSWESIRVDEKEINKELKKPSNVNTSKKTFYFVREQIVKTVFILMIFLKILILIKHFKVLNNT